MKFKHKSLPHKKLIFAVLTTAIIFSSCQKELSKQQLSAVAEVQRIQLPQTTNPFSLRNVQKAQAVITANGAKQNNSQLRINAHGLQEFIYFKFDPSQLSQELFQALENDSTVKLLDIPFANASLYNETFALDEAKAAQLKDGFVYGVTDFDNAISLPLLKNAASLNKQFIDTLALIPETDTALQFEAYRQAGATEQQIEALRICLFKRPSGFVRYLDQETNRLVNVPGMQVWGLVFGIPVHTYTDDNGYYRLPWRFSAGTIMGTHAKNNRVNIKPINTQGAWWLTIPIQFIVGSLHIHGWVGACQMRDDINIEFRTHRQNRYWAQLMHSVRQHDNYSANDGINSAPQKLVMYAHWDDNYGSASAPMLGHISSTPASLILQFLTGLLNGTDPNTYPNIFNLLTGLLPDITIKTGSTERQSYSSRLMQISLHELGHGSHFRRAGQTYWIDLIRATLRNHPDDQCGGGYGCGQNPDDGNVAIGESWAEFIGTIHALRNHTNGVKNSRWQSLTTTGQWNFYSPIRFDRALEREPWFFNNWIASGIYNDLMDVINADPAENIWDRTGGLTIRQLYEALGPNIDFFCDYEWEIINSYGLNTGDVDEIFVNNGAGGCL